MDIIPLVATIFERYEPHLGWGGAVGGAICWLIWVNISSTTPTLPLELLREASVLQIVHINNHNIQTAQAILQSYVPIRFGFLVREMTGTGNIIIAVIRSTAYRLSGVYEVSREMFLNSMVWLSSLGWEHLGELAIGVSALGGLYIQMGNYRLIDFFRALNSNTMVNLDQIRIIFFNLVENYILNPGYISQPTLRINPVLLPLWTMHYYFLIPSLVWDSTLEYGRRYDYRLTVMTTLTNSEIFRLNSLTPNTLTPLEEGAIEDFYENLDEEEEDFEEEDEEPPLN